MLKNLLKWTQRRTGNDLDDFFFYIIAVSFRKMNTRMKNADISVPYYDCIQKLKEKPFAFIPIKPEIGDRNCDKSFVDAIPLLARVAKTELPNLESTVKLPQPVNIYNESTYMEFHLLLCELLSKFKGSLDHLETLKNGNGKDNLKRILDALKQVRVLGYYLRTMVGSSAIGAHLQNINHLLVVNTKKSWTIGPDDEDTDFTDFHLLKPYSVRKGKLLSPWESYRDWLRLMVHYFSAANVLVSHVNDPVELDSISIVTLSPPNLNAEMLPGPNY